MWPPYGLPPNYSPPFKETSGVVQSTQHVLHLPLFTEAHSVIHTTAYHVVHPMVQPYFEDPHHVYHANELSDKEDERDCEIKGMKESFQVLEKGLRAMEGG